MKKTSKRKPGTGRRLTGATALDIRTEVRMLRDWADDVDSAIDRLQGDIAQLNPLVPDLTNALKARGANASLLADLQRKLAEVTDAHAFKINSLGEQFNHLRLALVACEERVQGLEDWQHQQKKRIAGVVAEVGAGVANIGGAKVQEFSELLANLRERVSELEERENARHFGSNPQCAEPEQPAEESLRCARQELARLIVRTIPGNVLPVVWVARQIDFLKLEVNKALCYRR